MKAMVGLGPFSLCQTNPSHKDVVVVGKRERKEYYVQTTETGLIPNLFSGRFGMSACEVTPSKRLEMSPFEILYEKP